ncbi:MAG: Metalloprotease MmpA [Holosporales bacterium]
MSIYTLLVIAFVFSMIVFVHEYGHFWVARKNGIRVDEFSIGFGPELLGWTDSLGTRWKISAIPLGGYVKMFGDADASSQRSLDVNEDLRHMTMEGKSPLQRIAVAAAGPVANFIFTIIAFCFLFTLKGISTIEPIIQSVASNSIAERVGLKPNDKFLEVDGKKIENFLEIRKIAKEKAGQKLKIQILRDDQQKTIDLELVTIDEKTGEKKPSTIIGFSPLTVFKPVPVLEAVTTAFTLTIDMIYKGFVGIISIITFQEKNAELGGLLTIGDQISKAADHGFWMLLYFMAFLSLQLGIINLLPIPVLDGGAILMNTIEMIIRRPINQKTQELFFRIGLFIVLSLMIYSNLSDLKRYTVIDKALTFFGFKS